jgi:hypothetical protein
LHESAPFPIPYFDNKKLKILFVDAKYQEYLLGADDVLQTFLKLDRNDRLKDSQMVKYYYDETLKFGYTKSLGVKGPEDIWNFVYPSEILIDQEENGDFYLVVSGECDWEEEHGLQLVFKNGQKLTKASGHDGDYSN